MDNLLSTVIWNGKTLGDLLTLDVLASLASSIVGALAIVVLGWFVAGVVRRRLVRMGQKYRSLDQTLFTFLGNLSRYAILAYTAIFVLNTFGVQTTSVVALIGAAGLAVGLALQGTLANVAAGVMIILFRPIKLGDFIEVSGQSGTVKDITLNTIELATLDNVQVIVPNGKVWGEVITNYSVYSQRRAEWVFGVSYSSDLKLAERTIREVIDADPRSLADPAPFVQVNNLGDYSVDFLVRYWCFSSEYWQFQADIKRKMKEAFDAKGIEIPFPTQTYLTAPT